MRHIPCTVLALLLLACPHAAEARHSADTTEPFGVISLGEALRAVQLFNADAYHCDALAEDGFAPGAGAQECAPHDSDYAPQDWMLSLSELLRLLQLYNTGSYRCCPAPLGEDGYCPGQGDPECPGESDTTPPVISLATPLTVAVPCGEDYTEPGFTASDAEDGDLTGQVLVDSSEVTLLEPGIKTVTYTVSDLAGNVAVRTRRVFSLCESAIAFADENLESAVREAIGKPNGDLLPADLADAGFTELVAATSGIADLTGLEYAVSLEALDLHGNCVSDLDALSHLDRIVHLNLHDNDIASVEPLRYLPSLRLLWLGRNAIEDIEPLAANLNLDGGGGQWDRINLSFNPLGESSDGLLDAIDARGAYVWRPGLTATNTKGANPMSARITLGYDDGEVTLESLTEFEGPTPAPKQGLDDEPRIRVRDSSRNEIIAPLRFGLETTSCGVDAPDGVSVGDFEINSTAEISITVPISGGIERIDYLPSPTLAPITLYPLRGKQVEKGLDCGPADEPGDPIPISARLIHGDPALPDERAFVLLIMGDAFPEEELGDPRAPFAASNVHYIPYAEAVADSMNFFLAQEPFQEFAAFMKIYRVDLVSEDNRPTDLSVEPPVQRDTALRMERKSVGFNYDQALCARVASNTGIAWDKVVLIPNGNGSGTQTADFIVYSNFSPSRKMTALHEFGHGIGVLSDEYEYRHGTNPPESYPPDDVDAPNAISRNLNVPLFDDIPWRHWLLDSGSDTCLPSTLGDAVNFACFADDQQQCQCALPPVLEEDCVPLVTCEPDGDFVAQDGKLYGRIAWPEPGAFPSVVGLFEGSKYRRKGAYRPELRCRMRSDDDVEPGLQETPLFCRVCRENLIAQILLRSGNVASAVPDPSEDLMLSSADDPVTFSVVLHEPTQPEHRPEIIEWRVDGNTQPNETEASLQVDLAALGAGVHTVAVTTYNPTLWLHPGFALGQQAAIQVITWNLVVN